MKYHKYKVLNKKEYISENKGLMRKTRGSQESDIHTDLIAN